MIGFVIVILFALNFPSEGQINLPPGGNRLVFEPGTNASINWTIQNDPTTVISRIWTFTSSNTTKPETLASIGDDGDPKIRDSSLPGVEIIKPATLVLKNVDLRYNGTYQFNLDAHNPSVVTVFIAAKPNVTINCFNTTTVDEGANVTCVCKAEGGNPPANVTWYRNDVQIDTKYEENMLTLSNVNRTDNGTYKCVAQSYTLKDEESFNLTVNFAPIVKSVSSSPKKPIFGQLVTITCEAIGLPAPRYTIIHDDTKNVSTDQINKTHIIRRVNYSDAGSYRCIAKNRLGNSSKTFNLTVLVPQTMPTPTPTTTKATDTAGGNTGTTSTATPSVRVPPNEPTDPPTPIGLIVGIIIGVLLLLLIIVFLLWWFKYRKEKSSGEHIGNDVNPSNQGSSAPIANENAYESLADGEGKKPENLYDEARLGNDNGGSGSTSDSLPPVYATADKDKDKKKNKKKDKKKDEPAPTNTPPVYATVDKTRHNEPSVTYATLDTVAMQPTGSSKRDRRDQPTEYASIAEFGVKGDLV